MGWNRSDRTTSGANIKSEMPILHFNLEGLQLDERQK